ncbi:hypothetical protein RFI_05787 [Reticulomyxa filosa]|uniref:Uncharacterized protein n=1 Tax=Reticulomyxa filosa TaxID=46433 RepID=X6NZM4_RETFI|nr:hypothetical protein RFI_05787 [Reticulomyxa filosa]|eukprot:ETO31333.1 hypothetical protein RFI_05787 [Reticulomyxa filosa]
MNRFARNNNGLGGETKQQPAYEKEQFDTAIQEADNILKSFPLHAGVEKENTMTKKRERDTDERSQFVNVWSHSETLAIKGLCLHAKGNSEHKSEMKTKGMETIKEALRQNLKSSMCWRAKGVVHRMDKDLPEAIACYNQAMRYDTNQNERILNEVSNLQLDLQRYADFEESRHSLWKLRPEERQYIVAELIACYLSKRFQKGLEFIATIIRPSKEKYSTVQWSDICLLQARMYKEKGDWNECLQFLQDRIKDRSIRDVLSAHEIRWQVYEAMLAQNDDEKKQDETKNNALAVLKQLLDINPENVKYYYRFMRLVASFNLVTHTLCFVFDIGISLSFFLSQI